MDVKLSQVKSEIYSATLCNNSYCQRLRMQERRQFHKIILVTSPVSGYNVVSVKTEIVNENVQENCQNGSCEL